MSSPHFVVMSGDLRTDAKRIQALGLKSADQIRKRRRLMIGSDGLTNTGKTEFGLSAPGLKALLPLDTSYDSILDNPNPPASRDLDNTLFGEIKIPMQGTVRQVDYVSYFVNYRTKLYELLDTPEITTIIIDGDSDSWELQVLAEFGRTSQIHPMQYPMVDAARRAMIKKCWESGKIIIATNKIKGKYEDVIGVDGLPMKDDKGKAVQRKVEGEYKRQGFRDQDYLWQLQIRHLFRKGEDRVVERGPLKGKVISKGKPEWGLRILKCKANPMLEGDELWGADCCFRGLVEHVYPNVDPTDWGFDR